MDKETLSNYGWIVICVLVLAVMIALATPFGTFVADAVKSTAQGLFDVNQNALNSTGLINIGDQSFGEGGNGGAGDQGSTNTLPEIGKTAEEYTWAEIKTISEAGKGDEYFNLGDTKTFTTTDGIEVVMEIVAFNADTKADGTGTAGITWISKNIVTTHNMNSSNTNAGGWEASGLRTWLQSDFYATLPNDAKNVIVSVNKTYYDSLDGSTESCVDNVWIPSYREILKPLEDSGVSYTALFGNNTNGNSNCIKHFSNGTASTWWLRSSYSLYEGAFCNIRSNGAGDSGAADNYKANKAHGVVLGFCT